MTAVKGVKEVKPSVGEKLVRVTFDAEQTNVKTLVKAINKNPRYRASEPKAAGKAVKKKTSSSS